VEDLRTQLVPHQGGGRGREIRLTRVGARHDRANRIGAPRAELDAGRALHLRYGSLRPRQTVHERVHERHEGGCRGQRRPCRVQAAADEQDAGVPHEPRLSVHRRHDGTVPTRPPSPVPRGLNTISPGHLDSVYLPQPRRRDRPRSSRRTEPPADSAGSQGAVQRPDERRIGGWHHHADRGPPPPPTPTHHPGPPGGSAIETVEPGAASARPTSRPRTCRVTAAGRAPGVPTIDTATAASDTRTEPTPRFAGTSVGGASASTRTPRGTSARPDPSAVRWRSLITCTSRPSSGSASTR